MKITRITPFLVDGAFRPWTFVKVETDEGVVGWGDCSDWDAAPVIAKMVEFLGEMIVGRDPMQAEDIWWYLSWRTQRQTGGVSYKAMSGIDSALWDIRGKALGAPVWQLLGGKMRDELRLYWTHCGSSRARHAELLGVPKVETTDDLRRLSEEVLDRGFTAIKTNPMPLKDVPGAMSLERRPGAGDISPGALRVAVAVVETFRDALGPDVGIALDVALAFRLGGAIKLARALEPFDMMWLETETFDPGSLRTVRESTKTPICHGESLFGLAGYKPFLQLYAQDVIMPDFAWNGITMGKKISDLALAHDTLIAPHNCHSPINSLVSANICATLSNFMIMEFDVDDAPWRDDLMTHPFEIKNGYLQLPDRPGLGSDLIESELKKHAYTG
ncbi:MAG: mandelate racemase/muconate lactonizing enzyme family protein [Chloroflexi bacterium]|nr:mandelate racemase/muconate lactonizing enzyme family protein [Chloroflexota bacterium]